MFKPHECGDSRLACIDCKGQVCPKCFVECPVGNRCRQCAGKFSSHVLNVTPAILGKIAVTALIMGAAFGFAQGLIPGGGIFMWLITYAIGVAAGNIIHKVGGFKIGAKVIAVASAGVIVGWAATLEFNPMDKALNSALNASPQINAIASNPELYRMAALNGLTKTDAADASDRKIMAMAASQQRLPELVAAFNRKDNCYVLAATTAGDSHSYKWYSVKGASSDQLEVLDAKPDPKAAPPEKITVASSDVIDWQYVGPSGVEGGFLLPELKAAANMQAANPYKSARMSYGLIDLVIFLAGIITVMSGQVPQFRLPYFRN